MLRNSDDHAFNNEYDDKKWYLSISYRKIGGKKKAKFSFADNGFGILETLRKKGIWERFRNIFEGIDTTELVIEAFKGEKSSSTGLPWRGKGLPTILELQSENIVKNLVVISNNVYINFEQSYKRKLNTSFSGTYYYWEIDDTCKKVCFD